MASQQTQPNAQLEAALQQFATEPGITPQQVAQLRAAILTTDKLTERLNKDAVDGHLTGFNLAVPGPESIGRYDLATGKVTIPSEVLSGTGPVDQDLRAVLRLQDMSLRFAHQPGITPDMHSNLEKTLNESPALVDQFKDAVRGEERQRHLMEVKPLNGVGAGGSFDPKDRSMNLVPSSLSTNFNQHDVTFVLGHEGEHSFNKATMDAAKQAYQNSVRQIASDNNPVNDYTPAALVRMQASRVNEAEAHIAGWNAMLSYEKERSGNPNAGLQEMWNNGSRSRVADFLELDANGAPIAKAGLTFNADGTLTPSSGSNGNVAAMGRHFFDQPPTGTPNIPVQDTMNLGPYNHSDYPNNYGPNIVGMAIWAERSFGVPKHGNASQMHINMQQLGLRENLVEENGLMIQPGSTATQTYYDTSTNPPTIGKFDHTYDGQNKNQHVLVDAPTIGASSPRMAGPGGSSGRDNDDEIQDILVRPRQPEYTPAPMMSEPGHAAHAMYSQALNALRTSSNIPAGTFTEHEEQKLAAGIVAQALTQKDAFPKASIDHVVMNRDGTMVIGVQGPLDSPANRLAGVNIQQALSVSSIEQSSDVARTAVQSLQQKQEQALVQAETLGVDTPTSTGPTMRIGARTLTPGSSSSDAGGAGQGGGDGGGGGGGGG